MSQALIIQHKTKAGKRDEVQRVWRQHMQPAISLNDGHLSYFYCFGSDPDTIVAFQQYASPDEAAAFLKTQAYADYLRDVTALLEGEPIVTVLDVQWSKPGGAATAA